ncbi:deoxyribonuclease-1-like 1 [Entelurus aequoreus]|uniref:deoxyribonuclease-1-like 1 n=1 Tax=Entelurus aequoreus TaxID=161455 RepID=UPI002B1D0548|nr:deoxyribonuclease-1-like 1 [Entelurus aequoreus]
MGEDVKEFVNACFVCALSKASHRPPAGLLHPLPIPPRPWCHIVLDFNTSLPVSLRNYVILNVNVMILGDFNADEKCVTHKGMKELRIRSDKNFHWLIGDDVDTTSNTANAHTYNRIVVYGDDVMAAIVPQSAKPFNFHREFSMTVELAQQVSDRYSVEVELSSSLPFWMTNPIQRRDVEHTLHATVNKALSVNLQADLSTLQKENLLLEREKLQLQISILKHYLTTLSRKQPQSNKLHNPEIFSHLP